MARNADLIERAEELASRCAVLLERNRVAFLALFSIAYFGTALALAAHKRFWYDELFTYYIASMPSLADIHHALGLSLDNHPLPFYVVTRAALHLLENEHVAARLPGMVGVWLAALCLFAFVARRTDAVHGVLAMATLFLTAASRYAVEARPYGLALGFSALALLAWQRAAEAGRRTVWLVGLALAVAAIVSTSFYATLAIAPIAMAELMRTRDRGRIDGPVWAAFAAGAATLFFYLGGLALGVESFSDGPSWAQPYRTVVIDMYRWLFGDLVLVVVAFLVVFPLVLAFRRTQAGGPRTDAGGFSRHDVAAFPRHEVVAAVSLLLVPVLGYVAAELAVNAITGRYVLASTLGFSVLLAWLASRAARGRALPGISVLVSLAILGAVGVAFGWRTQGQQPFELGQSRWQLAGQPADLPVMISDPLSAWELMHYERGSDRVERMYYVLWPSEVDSPAELAAWREEQTWLKLPRYFPVQAEELSNFLDRSRRFLLLDSESRGGGRVLRLLEAGAVMELVATGSAFRLYLVDATAIADTTATGGLTLPERSRPALR